jgi:hypothetical protein
VTDANTANDGRGLSAAHPIADDHPSSVSDDHGDNGQGFLPPIAVTFPAGAEPAVLPGLDIKVGLDVAAIAAVNVDLHSGVGVSVDIGGLSVGIDAGKIVTGLLSDGGVTGLALNTVDHLLPLADVTAPVETLTTGVLGSVEATLPAAAGALASITDLASPKALSDIVGGVIDETLGMKGVLASVLGAPASATLLAGAETVAGSHTGNILTAVDEAPALKAAAGSLVKTLLPLDALQVIDLSQPPAAPPHDLLYAQGQYTGLAIAVKTTPEVGIAIPLHPADDLLKAIAVPSPASPPAQPVGVSVSDHDPHPHLPAIHLSSHEDLWTFRH